MPRLYRLHARARPGAQRPAQGLRAEARDHLLGIEEREHVGEVGDQQQQAGGGHGQADGDGGARHVVLGDAKADPQRLHARHHEESARIAWPRALEFLARYLK